MKIINKISAVILSFLMALFLFISALSLILSRTFSNSNFMIDVLEKRSYYDNIFLEYTDTVEHLAIPAGVPEGKFSSVISKAEFKADINAVILSAYSESDGYAGEVIDYDTVYQKFYTCLTEVAVDNGFEINDELIPGLENVATLCAECYQTYVTVPFIDTIGSYALEFDRYFQLASIICGVFFLFFLIFLLISKVYKSISLSVLAITCNTVGFMMSIAPAVVFFSGKIRHINISVKSLYGFAVGYSESLLLTILICGIVFLALGIIFLVTKFLLDKRRKTYNSN